MDLVKPNSDKHQNFSSALNQVSDTVDLNLEMNLLPKRKKSQHSALTDEKLEAKFNMMVPSLE